MAKEREAGSDLPSAAERFFAKTKRDSVTGCLLWIGAGERYGEFRFRGRKEKAHRVAFFFKYGRWPAPNGLHRCDVTKCVEVEHLFEGTQAVNVEDMNRKGRAKHGGGRYRGESHVGAKLTDEECGELRRSTLPGVVLAKKFKVSTALVSLIRNGLRR